MSSDKKRVQFRAPNRFIDRIDALATILAEISTARIEGSNSYVQRARSVLDGTE